MTIGGVEITLGAIVDLIILIGALCAAIYKIWEFFAKPTSTLKKRKKEKERARIVAVLDEELPKNQLVTTQQQEKNIRQIEPTI